MFINRFLITLMIAGICLNGFSQQGKTNSRGRLSFKMNDQVFYADSLHARGYALAQSGAAFISGSNTENMVMDLQWNNMRAAGNYNIVAGKGKAEFVLHHKIYSVQQAGDFIKISITSVKPSGSFLLLNGTFEGQVRDKNGNIIQIRDGQFVTYSL